MHHPSTIRRHNLRAELFARDGTFNLGTGEPVTFPKGYQVGGYTTPLVNPTPDAIDGWLFRVKRLQVAPRYVGSWTAPDGTRYIDASQWFEDRAEALNAASVRGEQAIWDWANDESINVVTLDT